MWLSHILLGVGWVGYCCLHSILVTRRVKANMRTIMGGTLKYYRLVYSSFSIVGLCILIAWQYLTPTILLWRLSLWSLIPGAVIAICGLALMTACLQRYFSSHAGLKELVIENQQPVLLIIGLHRFVRHPLYLSTFVFLWGLFVMVPNLSLVISNFIITAYTLIGIKFEERKLTNTFGEAYTRYCKEVPMIIPRLKKREVGNRQ
jgi:protein-S-isoprenylcysteine O-methyltransferase Ste14